MEFPLHCPPTTLHVYLYLLGCLGRCITGRGLPGSSQQQGGATGSRGHSNNINGGEGGGRTGGTGGARGMCIPVFATQEQHRSSDYTLSVVKGN